MSGCTILLVRHGSIAEDEGERLRGWHDPPLSDEGRAQARRLCAHVPAGIDALYASPLRRALDTAECMGSLLRLPVGVDNRLREINCGRLDGMRIAEVERQYPELWRRNLARTDDQFRWPDGETYAEFRARVVDAIGSFAARHRGERILLVTHAGVITQVLGAMRGLPAADWASFRTGHASITEVLWNGNDSTIARFDDRDHLSSTPQTPPGA